MPRFRRGMHKRALGQPHELARFRIESVNRAILDIINPAIELEVAGRKLRRGARVRLEIAELTQYIFVNEGVEARAFVHPWG